MAFLDGIASQRSAERMLGGLNHGNAQERARLLDGEPVGVHAASGDNPARADSTHPRVCVARPSGTTIRRSDRPGPRAAENTSKKTLFRE